MLASILSNCTVIITFLCVDDEVPSHWYRMKAFDISAEFGN